MKKIICFCLLMVCVAIADAQDSAERVALKNVSVARSDGQLFVSIDMDVSSLSLRSEEELVLTPGLKAEGNRSRALPVVWLAGRNRYYRHLRNNGRIRSAADGTLYNINEVKEIHYRMTVPYEEWMEHAELTLDEDVCGCCSRVLLSAGRLLSSLDFAPKVFTPQFVYIRPVVEAVKTRELKGTAYIDFPVNRTEIREDYRNNPSELKKIRHSIEAVKEDADTKITSISIKGYASPEGSYANNARLAKGRTEALKEYVQRLYDFPASVFTTAFEPEDWEGLKRCVESSSLAARQDILDLIASEQDPDRKEQAIRRDHPSDYAYLLKEVYPGLRHSDYVVEYVVRAYTDVEEAKRILRTSPGKLSLQELYMIAASYPQGSEEYNEVFEAAVHLYPEDTTANLNAANVAMVRRDYVSAGKYLMKAGTDGHAEYARGVLAALQGDYDSARVLLEKAKRQGINEAEAALEQIDRITE